MLPSTIPIENLAAVLTALTVDLERRSFAEPLQSCSISMLEGVAQNFGAKVDSHGTPWPPRKDKLQHPLLRLANAMFAAVANQGGSGQVERIEDRALTLGVDAAAIPYARAQNYGHTYVTKRGTWVLPPREYMYLTDERVAMLHAIIGGFAYERIF